ncbi:MULTISPECIES: GntR family transcriptional regulator [unclassified Arthrobacter]|uniref:GntR family transcriptional regulator n=1 Tax=unclassified Arthrobacter TaxID=235627 RepID=UPI001E2E8D63|nr:MULTISPECIES: GntR family transcriptional regulator [unclassified Arthrobacter]MCC9144343.1 GntR family transcriptional regulator [Arthrobacter sp. zg-Y919]MDK1275569.1 GntR family transcriptional regulator [Arthrobacter sp. zg.Y919]WIB03059.1 GntR family transcriptional regulator [Arthrobacter sp. zg-Y919]
MEKNVAGGAWIERSILTDQVHKEILARLMDGKLESGASISIDGTARELGVSPTPVREALARLESTGLVTRAALRGYRAAPRLNREELLDLMDARLLLEPHNAEVACIRADDAFLAALEHTIEDLRQAPNGPHFADYRSYWEADERFHRMIAEQTDNKFLVGAYTSLGGHVHRFRLFSGTGVDDAGSAIEEHTRILDAMRRGDAGAARTAMAGHLRGVRERAARENGTPGESGGSKPA